MSQNPYTPAHGEVVLPAPDVAVSSDVLKKIRNAWIAGLISAVLAFVFTLLGASVSAPGFSAWQFLSLLPILGLTFGIYKKSRVCAIAMLVYFIAIKMALFLEVGKVTVTSLLVVLIFSYYFAQGVHGTFLYSKHIKY